MPRSFLSRPRELLTASGRFQPLEADGAAWRQPMVVLARELCAFSWFDSGRASGTAAAAAARLHARTAAPFSNPGCLVRRGPGGFAIWWWDRDWLKPHLRERFGDRTALVAPETLAQPPGEGWRIVRVTHGYEAQLWNAGSLVATTWRSIPFDEAAWRAFTRVQRGAPEAPPSPPAAQHLPLSREPAVGGGLIEFSPADALRLGVVVVIGGLAAAGGLFCGQALRLNALAKNAEGQADVLRRSATSPSRYDPELPRRIADFRQLSARPNTFAALSTALGSLNLHSIKPVGFSLEGPSITLTLPYSALGKVSIVTMELEASGEFAEVRPVTDPQSQQIDLKLVARGRDGKINQSG